MSENELKILLLFFFFLGVFSFCCVLVTVQPAFLVTLLGQSLTTRERRSQPLQPKEKINTSHRGR